MRFPKKIIGFAIGLSFAVTFAAAQEQQQPLIPYISILRVGPSDVSNGQHIVLQQPLTDVFGRAWNYQNKEFYALIRFQQGRKWYVAAASKSEPGGVFNIGGITFPQAGDFELLVIVREPDSLAVGNWLDEFQWSTDSLAVSNRVAITIEGAPIVEGDSGEGQFHLALLSVADVGLRPGQINAVPASGDVMLRARGLPNSNFYLAVHIPYTDQCYIIGPAKKSEIPDTYSLGSVSFEALGDPTQVHFDLVAFATSRAMRPGPMSWQSFRLSETIISPTTQIVIEGRGPGVEFLRTPFIAITRIGKHVIDPAKPQLDVDQGDLLEVAQYERTTEGARMWALTRAKGSNVWLAQGPLLPRGLPSSEAEDGHRMTTWVLPGLQFQSESEQELAEPEFEIMAVLSNSIFPNSWISTSSISARTIETISKPVAVSVEGYAVRSNQHLSITRIGSQEADGEKELTVGMVESVVIERSEGLLEPFKVYLAKHEISTDTWSFVEAIPNGKTHYVPAVSFSNPHALEGARYQVVAIATTGPLPAREAEYHDFIQHVVMSSDLVSVRYSSSFVAGWTGSLQPLFSIFSEGAITTMLLILLLVILTLLLILAGLIWLSRSNPALAGEIADTLQHRHVSTRKRFVLPEKIDLPWMLVGIVLLVGILYFINNYYISLYTTIVKASTKLDVKSSRDLAIFIILVTALTGIFADISHKQKRAAVSESGEKQEANASIHEFIFWCSVITGVVLWLFQGIMYSTFLSASSPGNALMTPAGFGAGLLISITETITFFVITELTLAPVGLLILTIILAPLSLGALIFRLLQRVFTPSQLAQKGTKPPPPEPAESEEPEETTKSTPLKDEP